MGAYGIDCPTKQSGTIFGSKGDSAAHHRLQDSWDGGSFAIVPEQRTLFQQVDGGIHEVLCNTIP